MEQGQNLPQPPTISERGLYKLIQIPYQGTSICLSKISKHLVFSSREGHVVVINSINHNTLLDLNISTSSLWNVHISPDESTIIAGGATGNLYRALFPSGQILPAFVGHTSEINHCVFTSDGSFIYTASDDGTIRKWDSNDGSSEIVLDHGRIIYSFDLSKDEKFTASGDSGGYAKLLDLNTNQLWNMNVSNSIWCIKISPFNRFVIAGDAAGTLTIWTMDGELMRVIKYRHTDRLRSVGISDCEKYFASTGNDHLIKIWKTNDWDEEITFNIHTDWNKTVIYDSDNKTWISISDNKTISIVNTPSQWGAKVMSVEGRQAYFHPELKKLIVVDKQYLHVCDLLTGETINKVKFLKEKIEGSVKLLICDNGMILVSEPRSIQLIDYISLQVTKRLDLDDKSFAVPTEKKILIFGNRKVKILNSDNFIEDFEFSTDFDCDNMSVFNKYSVFCCENLIYLYKKQKFINQAKVDYRINMCKQFDIDVFYVVSNVIHAFSTLNCEELATARYIQVPIDLKIDSTYLYSITKSSLELYSKTTLIIDRQIVFHQKIQHFSKTLENYTICTNSNEVYFHKSLNDTYYVLDSDTNQKITLKS